MKNNKKYILVVVIILVLIFLSRSCNRRQEIEESSGDKNEAVIEEVKNIEEVGDLGPITIKITGPEGEEFYARQARMYKAEIENREKYMDRQIQCQWRFYLNENNEEVQYEEMDNSSIIRRDKNEICGFTSTFIEKKGVLRVELTINITDRQGNVLDTTRAERMYRVI